MKTWKRMICLCLALILLTSAMPVMAADPAGLLYELRDDGLWITGAYSASGELILPEEINGQPVVGIAQRAFHDNPLITFVSLPQSLRFIEAYAFYDCCGIRGSIQIPDSVEWIGTMAFHGTRISGKKYSAAHRYAEQYPDEIVFTATGSMDARTVVREDGLVYWLHEGEAELIYISPGVSGTLYLPETVAGCPLTVLGPNCCTSYRRSNLYNVVIPGTVERIGAYAFYGSRLYNIFLSEGVKELQNYALCTTHSETILTLPASLEVFGDHVFEQSYQDIYPLTVYAYSSSPAAAIAAREGVNRIRRDGANGNVHGSYAGLNYAAANGKACITDVRSYCDSIIPAEIEGNIVTEMDLEDFSSPPYSNQQVYIPPTVTTIHTTKTLQLGYDYVVYVYPGSYAERFCREYGYAYESIFTAMGVPFTDIAENLWYYEPVCHVYNTGLMSGVSDTRFAPEDTTTRAMLVTVLWRLAGSPKAETKASFSDIVPGSWYAAAVSWAQEQGIVQGVSETRFAPNDPVSREQIATILLRYAQKTGLDDSRRANVSGFPDAAQISPWAMEGIRWAKAKGILNGQLSGNEVYLNPRAGAKRSEIAAILMRFTI